jgi:hypothetical protein
MILYNHMLSIILLYEKSQQKPFALTTPERLIRPVYPGRISELLGKLVVIVGLNPDKVVLAALFGRITMNGESFHSNRYLGIELRAMEEETSAEGREWMRRRLEEKLAARAVFFTPDRSITKLICPIYP